MANETEEQQIADIKKWWSENATSIIVGLVIGLAGVFGFKGWQSYQENLSERASTIYTVMVQGLETDNRQLVSERADTLITQYSSSPYAAIAALALAKIKIREGDLDAANTQLQWVLDNGDVDVVRDTARLRLARVLIAQQHLDEAGALLDQPRSTTAFDALYTEVAGDIYSARGNSAGASEAYQRALAATPARNPGYQLLQLKYENSLAVSNIANEISQ
ncbi:MAG: tetratricopeptide repeat protein [Gammaproteobacteria bacterium]|nr:tetratricopeptide repeat protein [Gammaproteobacteria bacterium]